MFGRVDQHSAGAEGADVVALGDELGPDGHVIALAALWLVVEYEGFVFAPELTAFADDVVNGAEYVVDFEEELTRPVEPEGWSHHGDDVEVPYDFFARGGDESVRSVDFALLAVALDHFEAGALARGVEVGEVDSIGDGLFVNPDH
eukprot:scaffold20198_cov160-Isochrysis_galbana.AAC.2